ncbi:MAG: hypothetical protein LDL41_02895 [Coleofasciculus sp. S288]|nr:hypothetical protein [Coleofasciculus sp. S288]
MKTKNSKTQAIAFILMEFTLPILLGLIHPALEVGVTACFTIWAICKVIQEQEKQEQGL